MKLAINTQDLTEGLNIVTRAIGAHTAKQILEGVFIQAKDNRISLTCTDGSFTIIYVTSADITEEGKTVLPGRLFTELIRKMPGGSTTIEANDKGNAQIRCMKNRSNIATMDSIEYPEIAEVKKGIEIKIPQKKLKNMISHALFALSTDENRQILTGCLFEITRTEARIVSLDGFKLSLQILSQPFELPDGIDIVKFVIPGKIVTELSRVLQDDDSFCLMRFDKGRIQCEFANIVFSSVLLVGDYIDYRKIIPENFKTKAALNRVSVQDAIDRAGLMAREGKNNLIKMSFQNDILKVYSKSDMGISEDEIETCIEGDNIEIAFNAKYITDVIKNVEDENIIMKFNTSVSPCIIVSKDHDDYLYLVLPVRVF